MTYLSTFFSVSDALYFEKIWKVQGLSCKVIPVPRELSSSCGYAVEFSPDLPDTFRQMLTSHGIEIESLYQILPLGGKTAYAPRSFS